jgi:signal recognition particle subunit SEC65
VSQYTNAEKAKEARREALLRERVYPRWVEQGRLSKDTAARQLAIMEEIAQDLAQLAEKDRLL